MARFKIYSKDGQSVRYEGKPKYLGVYLNPSCLKFSEISSSEPIAWEVGDYVDYPRTGMRYRLYSIPQPSKEARRGSYGGAFRYSGVELYAATKELEIALFRDLVGNDNNVHFSTSPDVATFEDVYGIARRIQACMDDLYPDRWEIRVADFDDSEDAEIIEKISEAKDFALSGGTCLDALSKIYELWQDIGWIHSYENGKEVITIGYANKRIADNTSDAYLYGKDNGLTAIKKNQTNKDDLATRLYVYGSERNLPSRYYNGLDILNAESVDIRNLMLPLDSWGKTDGLPDARKAYLENSDAVAKFGIIPKTHYFDSEDAGANIYPSVEGITIGQIRNVLADMEQAEYVPSASIYSDSERADEVLSAVNPEDDGVMNRGGRAYDLSANVSVPFVTRNVDVFPGATRHFIASNYPLMSYTFETTGKGKITLDPDVHGYAANRNYSSVKVRVLLANYKDASAYRVYSEVNIDAEQDEYGNWAFDLPAMSVTYDKTDYSLFEANVYLSIEATLAEPGDYDTASFTIMNGSAFWGFNRIASKEFKVSLKQIGFDINERAALVEGKVISMKSGMCEGRNFVISSCKYVSDNDSWLLTCKRQQDDTLGMLFPNSGYAISAGDRFILLDIAMPELYLKAGELKLLSEGEKLLARVSKIQSHYEPSIDAKVMAESGRILREGMFMEITDEDVVDNTTDYILIDTLSIAEDEGAIPTYKVTLRERRKVTYKGTPSATSATETKSVEDETEVQPNVDLTGYAKETYVNDKVSEVNDLLVSMWSFDADGNLVTEKQVIVKNNIIISGDTSTDGTGENPSVSGTVTGIRVDANTILEPTNGIVDMSDVLANLEVDVDLSDYYTALQTDAQIANAVAGLNLGQYAKTSDLATLQTEVDNIEAVLGMDEEAEGIINTWNEVKAFLGTIEVDDDLASILERMSADIDKRALDSDLDALALTVGDNTTNIKNLKDSVYTKEDLATYKSWWDDLMGLIVKDGTNNIKINGNLIVAGDTSSTARGTDSGTDGTLIGVIVNGTRYEDETNGMLDLSSLMNQYVTSEWITNKRFATISDLASAIGPLGARVETLETAGYITSSALVGYATQSWVEGKGYITGIDKSMVASAVGASGNSGKVLSSTGGDLGWVSLPTSLPASDVYAWAKASTKPSYTTTEVSEGTNLYFTNARAVSALSGTLANYLPLTGGTLSNSNWGATLILKGNNTSAGLQFYNNGAFSGLMYSNDGDPVWYKASDKIYPLIHSGNIGSQYVKGLASPVTIWGQSFDGTENVSGGLSAVQNIDFASNNLYDIGSNSRQARYIYAGWFGSKTGENLSFGANNGSHFYIATNGYVGINKSAPEYQLDVNGNSRINGNLIVAGDTATGSDIRFKDRIADHRIALSDIAEAPLFTFKWNDREDKTVHLGSSAQYWEGVAPWLVKGTDFKVLDYSTLGVAIGISLANKTLNLEDRVKILERENEQLKEQIRRIQYGS